VGAGGDVDEDGGQVDAKSDSVSARTASVTATGGEDKNGEAAKDGRRPGADEDELCHLSTVSLHQDWGHLVLLPDNDTVVVAPEPGKMTLREVNDQIAAAERVAAAASSGRAASMSHLLATAEPQAPSAQGSSLSLRAVKEMIVNVSGMEWCGVVWCGVVWCGVVWCGVVWCGVAHFRDRVVGDHRCKRLLLHLLPPPRPLPLPLLLPVPRVASACCARQPAGLRGASAAALSNVGFGETPLFSSTAVAAAGVQTAASGRILAGRAQVGRWVCCSLCVVGCVHRQSLFLLL
jgi:hypothetical protein